MMNEVKMGILMCGLNGAGKSTLGRMLADRMGYEFIDNKPARPGAIISEIW